MSEHYKSAELLIQQAQSRSDLIDEERARYALVAGAHATLALVDATRQREVVDATIYCGHKDCSLPDGHLSEHGPKQNGFRAWRTVQGSRIGVASDDRSIEIAISAGPAHFELVLTGPVARELAEDLLRRADKTEVPF